MERKKIAIKQTSRQVLKKKIVTEYLLKKKPKFWFEIFDLQSFLWPILINFSRLTDSAKRLKLSTVTLQSVQTLNTECAKRHGV